MRRPPALVALAVLCWLGVACSLPASAQQAPRAAASRAAPSPVASQLRAQKVVVDKDGKESLDDAANVTIGDTVQYSAVHKNVSQRRLLQVDFGIPIPHGTSYVEGSATPEGARRVRLDRQREQMLWRVDRIEPGEVVSFSLRVRVDPDPTLTPVPAEPRKPQFRRQAP